MNELSLSTGRQYGRKAKVSGVSVRATSLSEGVTLAEPHPELILFLKAKTRQGDDKCPEGVGSVHFLFALSKLCCT
jgi:hypothetical protein